MDDERATPEPEVVELDHRSSGSIDVSLFWNRRAETLLLQVIDWADDEDFAVSVEPATALQAFRHPFVYAPRRAAAAAEAGGARR